MKNKSVMNKRVTNIILLVSILSLIALSAIFKIDVNEILNAGNLNAMLVGAIQSDTGNVGNSPKGSQSPDSYLKPGVYVEGIRNTPPPITGIDAGTAAFVGITEASASGNTLKLVKSFSEFQEKFGGYLPESYGQYRFLPYAVKSFFLNGGKQCYIVSITPGDKNNIVPEDFYGRNRQTGIRALEQVEDISVVAVPGVQDSRILNYLVTHCETMKDRFAILDMPESISDSYELRNYRDQFDTPFAAVYHPWLGMDNPTGSGNLYIPPSGAIAGIYAQNDLARGVHKAPANLPVAGINGLKYNISSRDQASLNQYGINLICFFAGRGNLVYGARTCTSDGQFKYIPTQRYIMYLQKSIEKGTRWVVFEPNNERLWTTVKRSIEEFLTREWQKGALMGTKANEAFFVRMDRSTMTQTDISQGKTVAVVGAATERPAEFVVFNIVHGPEPVNQ